MLNGCSNVMTFRVNASLPATDALASDGISRYSPHGPDAAKYLPYRNSGMRAGGGQCSNGRRKMPVIQPLSKPRDWRTLLGGFILGGSPNLASEVRLEPDNNDSNVDICGRHFLFDDPCARLERTRTVIPQLSRNYHVHRPGNLHPCSLSKELSHSHSGRPFTLGYHKRYEVNTTPALFFPSTLVLNGRNTFTVENCKLSSRPSVKYPTNPNLLSVKDYEKSQSYPDPVVGASRSFIHRAFELSSLEGETVRQEKLKRMRKPKKTPS
ncbi:uncharacterized protein si:ch211-171b20.3 isoform X2 [Pseudoliparis swirei]|uniref:uncharacterized protein si:ch211-171b20.3 isoform X2 n=1 Tax=Pseudoliparis swirei TaxID=2059687 RepID=UPI0024BDB1FC|nr:uncharacterized protein si:ch211-171b20.3 isoform X2 [Pseudoliparis swirei]